MRKLQFTLALMMTIGVLLLAPIAYVIGQETVHPFHITDTPAARPHTPVIKKLDSIKKKTGLSKYFENGEKSSEKKPPAVSSRSLIDTKTPRQQALDHIPVAGKADVPSYSPVIVRSSRRSAFLSRHFNDSPSPTTQVTEQQDQDGIGEATINSSQLNNSEPPSVPRIAKRELYHNSSARISNRRSMQLQPPAPEPAKLEQKTIPEQPVAKMPVSNEPIKQLEEDLSKALSPEWVNVKTDISPLPITAIEPEPAEKIEIAKEPIQPVPYQPSHPRKSSYVSNSRLEVETRGPRSISLGQVVDYYVLVRNFGEKVENVAVDFELPPGAKVQKALPRFSSDHTWYLPMIHTRAIKEFKVSVVFTEPGYFSVSSKIVVTRSPFAQVTVHAPKLNIVSVGEVAYQHNGKSHIAVELENTGKGDISQLQIQGVIDGDIVSKSTNTDIVRIDRIASGDKIQLHLPVRLSKAGTGMLSLRLITNDQHWETNLKTPISVKGPELEILTRGTSSLVAGEVGTYYVEINNQAKKQFNDLQIEVKIPEEFSLVDVSGRPEFKTKTNTLVWNVDRIKPGENHIVRWWLHSEKTGEHTQEVTVDKMGQIIETSELVTRVASKSNIVLELTDIKDTVLFGEDVVYRVKVINNGNGPATDIYVDGFLEQSLKPFNSGFKQKWEGQQVAFDKIDRLGPNESVIFQVRARPTLSGKHKFYARVAEGIDYKTISEKVEETTVMDPVNARFIKPGTSTVK